MEDVEAGRTIAESELFLGEKGRKMEIGGATLVFQWLRSGVYQNSFPSQLSPLLYDCTNKNKTHSRCT